MVLLLNMESLGAAEMNDDFLGDDGPMKVEPGSSSGDRRVDPHPADYVGGGIPHPVGRDRKRVLADAKPFEPIELIGS